MKFKTLKMTCLTICVSSMAFAQNLSPIGAAKDWTVFQDPSNPKHCYVVSTPTGTKAFKDGKETNASRGDIRFYVGIKNGATEPAFLAGYPLANDKAVETKIGGQVFNFFTNPNANAEYSWPSPKSDAELIGAMKNGTNIEVTAISKRGTQTVDTFSLSGFTAAYGKAISTCK